MHQPKFLGCDTISYARLAVTPDDLVVGALLQAVNASWPGDPVEALTQHKQPVPAELADLAERAKTGEADAVREFDLIKATYLDMRKAARLKLLAAVSTNSLWVTLAKHGAAQRLVVRTPTDVLANVDLPGRYKSVSEAMLVVVTVFAPPTEDQPNA